MKMNSTLIFPFGDFMREWSVVLSQDGAEAKAAEEWRESLVQVGISHNNDCS